MTLLIASHVHCLAVLQVNERVCPHGVTLLIPHADFPLARHETVETFTHNLASDIALTATVRLRAY